MKTLYLEKKSTHRIQVKNFFILVVTWLILKYDLKKKSKPKKYHHFDYNSTRLPIGKRSGIRQTQVLPNP